MACLIINRIETVELFMIPAGCIQLAIVHVAEHLLVLGEEVGSYTALAVTHTHGALREIPALDQLAAKTLFMRMISSRISIPRRKFCATLGTDDWFHRLAWFSTSVLLVRRAISETVVRVVGRTLVVVH
jgi:hypothetical protein